LGFQGADPDKGRSTNTIFSGAGKQTQLIDMNGSVTAETTPIVAVQQSNTSR